MPFGVKLAAAFAAGSANAQQNATNATAPVVTNATAPVATTTAPTTAPTTAAASNSTAPAASSTSSSSSSSSNDGYCMDAPAVEVNGKHWYTTTDGTYLPIKGVAYYPRPNAGANIVTNIDFFTDDFEHIWSRDVAQFRDLGINVVRIFAVDPSKSHDKFMCALKDAGIYAIIGLSANCPGCYIGDQIAPTCYPAAMKTRGQYIINAFAKYSNVLAYTAGSQVATLPNAINDPSINAPCLKKFVRDMRAYINSCDSLPNVPIGVVEDDNSNLGNLTLYYSCRTNTTDELENIEWFGFNQFRNCDATQSTVEQLDGYKDLLTEFAGYNIASPVMFSGYGCVDPSFPTIDGYAGQRTFLDVDAMFADSFLKEFTGGNVFEYSVELVNSIAPYPFTAADPGNFGLTFFEPEDCDDVTIPCVVVQKPEFQNLADKYASVSRTLMPPASDGRPNATECPSGFDALSDYVWDADGTDDIGCPANSDYTCPTCDPANAYVAPNTTDSGMATGDSNSTNINPIDGVITNGNETLAAIETIPPAIDTAESNFTTVPPVFVDNSTSTGAGTGTGTGMGASGTMAPTMDGTTSSLILNGTVPNNATLVTTNTTDEEILIGPNGTIISGGDSNMTMSGNGTDDEILGNTETSTDGSTTVVGGGSTGTGTGSGSSTTKGGISGGSGSTGTGSSGTGSGSSGSGSGTKGGRYVVVIVQHPPAVPRAVLILQLTARVKHRVWHRLVVVTLSVARRLPSQLFQ